ncbi:MAG: FISUMP domain-containing protein [Bacteroidales bacterium]
MPDKSIFREQFVSALTSDMADGNRDGYVTGSELGDFLQTTVTNYSYNSQHPQFGKIRNPLLDKGDYVFLVPGMNLGNQSATGEANPTLGEAVMLKSLGGIELTSQIEGLLYIDGKELGRINANTIIPINNITEGNHLLEIRGEENWERTVTVFKDQNTRLVAIVKAEEDKFSLSRSGGFKDPRFNREYKWVRIGQQVWMAENLDYQTTTGSWCPGDDEENCSKYGRLYDWETAKRACPDGWHLPSNEEWMELEIALGMSVKESEKSSYRGKNEGGKLKADEPGSWKAPNKGSVNESNFSALPAGYRLRSGEYKGFFNCAVFWSSTEDDYAKARIRELYYNRSDIYSDSSNKMNGFSVRCVKNRIGELHYQPE